jgi:hypothetical protein
VIDRLKLEKGWKHVRRAKLFEVSLCPLK